MIRFFDIALFNIRQAKASKRIYSKEKAMSNSNSMFEIFVMNGHCLVKSTVRIGENSEQVKAKFLEEYSAFKEPQYDVRVEPFIYEDEEDSIWLGSIDVPCVARC